MFAYFCRVVVSYAVRFTFGDRYSLGSLLLRFYGSDQRVRLSNEGKCFDSRFVQVIQIQVSAIFDVRFLGGTTRLLRNVGEVHFSMRRWVDRITVSGRVAYDSVFGNAGRDHQHFLSNLGVSRRATLLNVVHRVLRSLSGVFVLFKEKVFQCGARVEIRDKGFHRYARVGRFVVCFGFFYPFFF